MQNPIFLLLYFSLAVLLTVPALFYLRHSMCWVCGCIRWDILPQLRSTSGSVQKQSRSSLVSPVAYGGRWEGAGAICFCQKAAQHPANALPGCCYRLLPQGRNPSKYSRFEASTMVRSLSHGAATTTTTYITSHKSPPWKLHAICHTVSLCLHQFSRR